MEMPTVQPRTATGAGAGPLLAAYDAAIATRGYQPDPAQKAALQRLQQLADALLARSAQDDDRVASGQQTPGGAAAPASGIKRLLGKLFGRSGAAQSLAPAPVAARQTPKSVYLWGGVGRGKSFLMDLFFANVPFARKRRVHFHAFMQETHERLKRHKKQPDPLRLVAAEILETAQLLCFDEFHVSDIADAMILGRLLDALWAQGAVLVMTSNYHPDGLYPNGLMRVNFLPTIERIKAMCDVIEVDSGTDYRLRTLENVDLYLTPLTPENDAKLAADFQALTGVLPQPGTITLFERTIPTRGNAAGVIWFDFAALCDGPRGQADYLAIANEYHTVILSNVPAMSPAQAEAARRFTWLIDVLYDHRVKLIVSAAVEPYDLYPEGRNANEFARTVSRLLEMRTRAYLEAAHASD